jgi:hypothetical protein
MSHCKLTGLNELYIFFDFRNVLGIVNTDDLGSSLDYKVSLLSSEI